MTEKRYGAVIVERVIGKDLPSPVVRFLRSIEDKKFRQIFDGERPTNFGRYTGRHELFLEIEFGSQDQAPEYDVVINDAGAVELRRRAQLIELELFGIEYLERTEAPNL